MMASAPATMVLPIITGMVGSCIREPASTITTGSSRRMFQLYITSSWLSMEVTASEVTPTLASAPRPTMA